MSQVNSGENNFEIKTSAQEIFENKDMKSQSDDKDKEKGFIFIDDEDEEEVDNEDDWKKSGKGSEIPLKDEERPVIFISKDLVNVGMGRGSNGDTKQKEEEKVVEHTEQIHENIEESSIQKTPVPAAYYIPSQTEYPPQNFFAYSPYSPFYPPIYGCPPPLPLQYGGGENIGNKRNNNENTGRNENEDIFREDVLDELLEIESTDNNYSQEGIKSSSYPLVNEAPPMYTYMTQPNFIPNYSYGFSNPTTYYKKVPYPYYSHYEYPTFNNQYPTTSKPPKNMPPLQQEVLQGWEQGHLQENTEEELEDEKKK
jgi:hypothetical protein